MAFESFIAKRYLSFRKESPYSFMISIFAIVGILVGVMTLITVIAVMTGAQSYFKKQLLRTTSHITLQHISNQIEYPARLGQQLSQYKEIEYFSPYVYVHGLLQTPAGNVPAIIKGVSPDSPNTMEVPSTNEIKALLHTNDMGGILLGAELAKQIQVNVGDTVSVISPGDMNLGNSSLLSLPAAAPYRVIGTLTTGVYDLDKALAYVTLQEAQKLSGLDQAVTGFDIRLHDVDRAVEVSREINFKLGYPFTATPWTTYYKDIFATIQLQKVVLFIVFALIILVAAFNIASTLIIMVMEKQKDISVLRAMGTQSISIGKIFVVKGLLIGVSGILGGLCLGLLSVFLLSRWQFIELPYEVYNFSRLPVEVAGSDITLIIIVTLFLCFLCSLYPAWKAARTSIVDGLR